MYRPNEIYRLRARKIQFGLLAYDAFPTRIRPPREDTPPNTLHLCEFKGRWYYADYHGYCSIAVMIVDLCGGPMRWHIWRQYDQLEVLLRIRQLLIQDVVDGIGDR